MPVPGNDFLTGYDWLALHHQYETRARLQRPRVVFLGDSTTYLWGNGGRDAPGSAEWNARFFPLGAANFGIPGDMTQNVPGGSGPANSRASRVAVVQVGVNNLTHQYSPDDTAAGIAEILRAIRIRSPTTRILLLGILPAGATADNSIRLAIRDVNSRIEPLGRSPGVDYLDIGGVLLRPDGTFPPGEMAGDLHPTATGYHLLADALEGTLRGLLHGARARP